MQMEEERSREEGRRREVGEEEERRREEEEEEVMGKEREEEERRSIGYMEIQESTGSYKEVDVFQHYNLRLDLFYYYFHSN